MEMDAMGPEAGDEEYLAEEDGGIQVKPAGVAEKFHPVSTHLHPSSTAGAVRESTEAVSMTVSMTVDTGNPAPIHGTATTAVLAKAAQINAAKAKGYTGNACSECGQLTMVRNGACEKCDSCGATSGCS
jgi:ribonucleoside-diphosphate reductase alpha chain